MTLLKRRTKLELVGRGVVAVDPSDYMTSGGEASIYRTGNTIIKLYEDVDKMGCDNMVGKVQSLAVLKSDVIVAPQGVVNNARGKPVGMYMPFVKGEHLSKMFTNSFWQRNNFTFDDAVVLAQKMYDAVRYAHSKGAVMVDANELAWIVGEKKGKFHYPKIIDVDSWAIDTWGASVIMPSIRDWHSSDFNEFSDWFAWGVVSFQLFTGTHPFKGTLKGYKRSDMEKRMQENASVFRKGVRLNHNVRDFNKIPAPLLSWYKRTFEDGERSIPPMPKDRSPAAVLQQVIVHRETAPAGSLVFETILGRDNPAVKVFPSGIVLRQDGELYDLSSKRSIGRGASVDSEVVRVEGGWLVVECDEGQLKGQFISASYASEDVLSTIGAKKLFRAGDRLFSVTLTGLREITFFNQGKPIISSGAQWNILYNSTEWFEGVGIQESLGVKYVVIPFGENAVGFVRVKELDNLKIVAGSGGDRFVALRAVTATGEYKAINITLDKNHVEYAISIGEADHLDISMTHIPRGVVASIKKDNQLSIYVPSSGALKTVDDGRIRSDMQLYRWENSVILINQKGLSRIKMAP